MTARYFRLYLLFGGISLGSSLCHGAWTSGSAAAPEGTAFCCERQLTSDPWNHDLDNNDNFSPDDEWILYDHRDEKLGVAATTSISKVHVKTGRTEIVYTHKGNQSWGPGVAAASYNPIDGTIVVMSGLDSASHERPYELWRRTCALVDDRHTLKKLDARDVTEPFTPGALRGGTHRPEWSADGKWIGFTYDDAVLVDFEKRTGNKANLRTIGVATFLDSPVQTDKFPENNDGIMYSVNVARVTPHPKPGSNEIKKAFEDSWIGQKGYRRPDGIWQRHARAFLGTLVDKQGHEFTEVFVVDIPEQLDKAETGEHLEGTPSFMPAPPRGAKQRRLTHTEQRKYPGVSLLPRHWVRSSTDGSNIVYLAKDDNEIIQAYLVSPETGNIRQVTEHDSSIQSCARWSPCGRYILYVCDNAVTICDTTAGIPWAKRTRRLTAPSKYVPESPVWARSGNMIAFNRRVETPEGTWKQIFVIKPSL